MRVTIITPSFNSDSTIADTIASIDRQRGEPVEHLLIDGGSTDDTLRVVERVSQPWRHVYSGPDQGLYDAMNKGLARATGDVVGFLNSDDYYPADDVIEQVRIAFAEDPDLEGVYGDLCYVRQDEPSRVVRFWRSSSFEPGMFARGWAPPHPTLFLRRHVYERWGGFDPRFRIAADWELMARMLELRRIRTRYLPRVLVHMRLGGVTNRSWRNVVAQNQEIWAAMKMHRLEASLLRFMLGKLRSRGVQFVERA